MSTTPFLLPEAQAQAQSQALRTTLDLRRAQQAFADAAAPGSAVQSLNLAAASGRVLAQDVRVRTLCDESEGDGHWLRAGTRLDWFLLPLLAAGAQATVEVYEPLRCGVLALSGPAESAAAARVGAALVQGVLERMGAKVLGAGVADSAQREARLRMLARFSDLILVVDASAASSHADGLRAPPLGEIEGRPCLILPACPLAALASYVAFAVPLVRRLQGRVPQLPAIRHAMDAASGEQRRIGTNSLSCVGATNEGELRVRACAVAGLSLPEITGIGWRAEDLAPAGTVAYLSLGEWLR